MIHDDINKALLEGRCLALWPRDKKVEPGETAVHRCRTENGGKVSIQLERLPDGRYRGAVLRGTPGTVIKMPEKYTIIARKGM